MSKKMMTILAIIGFILMFLFIGHIDITTDPFRITLKYWHRTIGAILITAGLFIYCVGERHQAYIEGRDAIIKLIKERVDPKDSASK